jgi:hypothetical protein
MTLLRQGIHYSPMLVFQLVDATRRTFQTLRYCFLGSVDDWIAIGKPGKLSTLVKKYVKHLGQDSLENPPYAAAGRGSRWTSYPNCSRRRVRRSTL